MLIKHKKVHLLFTILVKIIQTRLQCQKMFIDKFPLWFKKHIMFKMTMQIIITSTILPPNTTYLTKHQGDEIEDFCITTSSDNTDFEGKRVSDFTPIRYKFQKYHTRLNTTFVTFDFLHDFGFLSPRMLYIIFFQIHILFTSAKFIKRANSHFNI